MTTYIGVSSEQIKGVADQIKKVNPDRTLCLTKFSKVQVLAPTKSRKTHKFKFEVEIPADTFVGDHVIHDFGGLILLDIASNRIEPKYLSEDS